MPQITETARLAREASAVWREIGGFGAVGAWHPMLARLDTEGEHPGAIRTAHGKDGGVQTERLREVMPDHRTYRYEMVATAMAVTNYVAEFRIDDIDNRSSKVRWQATFDLASDDDIATVVQVRAFFRAGLDSLASRYGKAPAARLLGINHVALEVGDLDAALEFYRRLFDFELRGRTKGMAFLDMGDQFLALAEGRNQPPDTQRHFGLVVDDRSGLRERAEAAGGTIVNGPGLEIRDPWGNRLEVVEYRRVQFIKTDAVLEMLNAAPEKTEEAAAELRAKGIPVQPPR